MPCNVKFRGKRLIAYLRLQGWLESEINRLQFDILLAESVGAEKAARVAAHDRVHARLATLPKLLTPSEKVS
jgi:hypothetical protein